MKIGLIGIGTTGKVIKKIALERGHEVSVIAQNNKEITNDADVYIDFSLAEGVVENSKLLCKLGIPLVLGTTGWYDDIKLMEDIFKESNNTCIWGGNFSLGVNLFFQIASESTGIMDKFKDKYDIMVHEYHHKKKLDSPSGTGIELGNQVLNASTVKDKLVTERLDRGIKANELHVSSTRGGSIPGTHILGFDSDFDSIEVKHTARTREGFALGAVITAEKIKDVKPGFYNFSEIFSSFF